MMERLRAWFDRAYRETSKDVVKHLADELKRSKDREQIHFNEIMVMRDRLQKIVDDPEYEKFFRKQLEHRINSLGTSWFQAAHDEYFRAMLPAIVDRKLGLQVNINAPSNLDFERLGFYLDLRIPACGHRMPIL